MDNPTHQDWLLRLRAGERTALKAIFDQQYTPVCQAIYRFVKDPGLTEDLAQEVFVRLWEKREQLHIDSNLGAYLRRMAVNEALAYVRKKSRYQADELPVHLPGRFATPADQSLAASELAQRITLAIQSLPPRCQSVFQLSRFEEKTYQEIADQLNISIKTVENQMGKALKIMREQLGDYLGVLIFFGWW
ncbi:MAG: RNA polymerase sigma-70 factor [Bacteroidetes bacterium]|nr:MAG: RNA polymerase sigma-70 factor [Bacteroidota bacterium]